jgi:hypothetical protein
VLRDAGENETTQENIRDWLEMDGDPGLQLLKEEEIAAVILFICFLSYFFRVTFCISHPD